MNQINIFNREIPMRTMAIVLMMSILSWTIGFSAFVRQAHAVSFDNVSVKLSTSNTSANANQSVRFGLATAIAASNTITITWPSDFDLTGIVVGDIDIGTASNQDCENADNADPLPGGCNQETLSGTATSTASAWGVDINTAARTIRIMADGGGVPVNGSIAVVIGTNTSQGGVGVNQINNPTTSAAYNITLTGAAGAGAAYTDSGDTWVVVQTQVTVSGTVASNFTFTVAAINNGGTVNGTSTNVTSTATTIPFGALATSGSNIKTAGHTLTSDHNAEYGFTVTLKQDGNFRSQGKTTLFIPNFNNSTSTPTSWTDPTENLSDDSTWGSFGLTTSDSDLLVGGVSFVNGSNARWTGFNTTVNPTVLNSTSSAKATAEGNGKATVGYRVQVSELQGAANDYQALVTYVATPTF